MDYPSRLKELSLPSMVYRRRRADVLQIFRIINVIDIVEEGKFIQLVDETVTRGHSLKLYKPRITSRIGGNILATRVVNDWNDLSDEVVKAESVNVFKTRLEEEWANKEWKTRILSWIKLLNCPQVVFIVEAPLHSISAQQFNRCAQKITFSEL